MLAGNILELWKYNDTSDTCTNDIEQINIRLVNNSQNE